MYGHAIEISLARHSRGDDGGWEDEGHGGHGDDARSAAAATFITATSARARATPAVEEPPVTATYNDVIMAPPAHLYYSHRKGQFVPMEQEV